MLLTLTVSDASHKRRGSVRLKLDWGKKKWFLEQDDPEPVWQRVGFSKEGPFEPQTSGVIWLWDQPHTHNTVIVWDGPASETVSRTNSGSGRIFDPKDPVFKDGKIEWTIEKAGTGALSDLREKARKRLTEILPAPYGSSKWKANPYHSLKPGPVSGYTNCVEFPAYVVYLLGGRIPPGYPIPAAKQHNAWVHSDGNRRPQPGDIYILCKTTKQDTTTAHVGVIYDASGNVWKTGDWGQGTDSWSGELVDRAYDAAVGTLTGEVDPTKGNVRTPRAISGWVDLDLYFANSQH